MLVLDSEAQRKHAEQDQRVKQAYQLFESGKFEGRHAHLVEDKRTSIANRDRQAGRAMTTSRFTELIHKLNMDLVVLPHPRQDDKACVYLMLPDGTKEFIVVMENGLMPEWSIMGTLEVRVPERPGSAMWKKTKVPGQEIQRGWRTVLIYLIRKKLVSLEAVERVFGPCNRESWAVFTGKQAGTPPI